jgi:hypothetical protein
VSARTTHQLFRQTLKQWFWDYYDHLLRLFVANIVLFILLGSAAYLWMSYLNAALGESPETFRALSLFFTVVLLAPIWLTLWFAPLGHFASLVAEEKDPGLSQLFAGLRILGPRYWLYFQTCCAIIGTLLLSFWFYLFSPQLGDSLTAIRYFLGGLSFWVLLFFLWMMCIGIPLIARQRHGIQQTIKISFVTVLRYPGFLLLVGIFLLSLWVIGIGFKLIGAMLFGFTGTMMLLNSTYDVLVKHEDEMDASLHPEEKPTTWKEIQELEKRKEKERMDKERYDRTLKDIIKPWED